MSTPQSSPPSPLLRLLSWALLPALAVMQFFDLRRAVVGPLWIWSSFLIGFALIAVVCLPFLLRRFSELSRAGKLVLTAMTLVWAYALITAIVTPRAYLTSRTTIEAIPPDVWAAVPEIFRTIPVITGALTMTAAVALVWVIPPQWRLARLWWAAWTIVGTSFIAFPRAVLTHNSFRLSTGMGGSATVHVVFLLCLGIFLGAVMQDHHRRWSAVGAAGSLVLILLTGSRAGALSLAVFFGLVVLWWAGRVSWKLMAAITAAGIALVALGSLVSPQIRRLFTIGDEMRRTNLEHALTIWTLGWRQVVFGAGSGRVWPWYAYEAKYYVSPHRGVATTPFGPMLTNPHSVPLGVTVELGLLGAALFAVVVIVPLIAVARRWRRWRADGSPTSWHDGMRSAALLAVCAGFVAFVFDYYLFKSFAVSFWWWTVLSVALLLPATPRPPAQPEPSTNAAPAPPAPDHELH